MGCTRYVEQLEALKSQEKSIVRNAQVVEQMYALLAQYDVKAPSEDMVQVDDLRTMQVWARNLRARNGLAWRRHVTGSTALLTAGSGVARLSPTVLSLTGGSSTIATEGLPNHCIFWIFQRFFLQERLAQMGLRIGLSLQWLMSTVSNLQKLLKREAPETIGVLYLFWPTIVLVCLRGQAPQPHCKELPDINHCIACFYNGFHGILFFGLYF